MVLQLHDRIEGITVPLEVEQLDEQTFRLLDNHIYERHLTRGTEIRVQPMVDGTYELVSVSKSSEFVSRRFRLSSKYTESDYRVLGDELEKCGGYWQVDFNCFLTVNIPRDLPYDVDKVMATLDLQLWEDVDDHGSGTNQ